jgi:Asp-tRNA(Asn)/Glu-tRNA(Gln) amidotransferase A subunit family amidase
LPIGVQIIGPLRGDQLVLRASRVIERVMPFPRQNNNFAS